uniref:Uncharacterized protein n=1 Tax=Rhodosorus marinus TaxID=101924 RepID=A0A7S3E9Z7_9RHOD|mmetsp:Transcript_1752/g.6557  ORF Transcript_1752/g.6557 Transcript_1752/m.6557 type:complete len:152 (+) Transcript_1752:433-888(+)
MAFVSGLTFAAKSAARADSACASRRSSVVMSGETDNKWKTQLAGGFPGGEGFFRKWLDEGMTGYVPDLDEEKQLGSKPAGGAAPTPAAATPTPAAAAPTPAASTPAPPTAKGEAAVNPPKPVVPETKSGDTELVMETDANGKMRFVMKPKE